MLPAIHIVCFAASYAVAPALELTRLLFRSGVRGAILIGFAGAGFAAHTLYLANQVALFYQQHSANASLLSSKQDWYLVAAWVLAVVYFYLSYFHPKALLGLFILPLILALVAVAALLADPKPFPREPASQVWGVIHGGSILLATVSVLFAFATGLMYLRQTRCLKQKVLPQTGIRLPSLEWLQRANARALTIALIMLAMGILSGMVLNLISWERAAEFVPWTDPVIVSTVLMFGWLAVTSVVGLVYRRAREGRAWLT